MYKKVELPQEGFVGIEREVAKQWKEKDIIKKNFAMNEGKRYFTFYDGPPTANGMPHVGHIETRVIKDIIPRYKVMKGYHVIRKAGWDTHGLPVELEIEKKLGISGKEQIEEYLAGKRKYFSLPLKLKGTDFMKEVWTCLQKIPYGEVKTYRTDC